MSAERNGVTMTVATSVISSVVAGLVVWAITWNVSERSAKQVRLETEVREQKKSEQQRFDSEREESAQKQAVLVSELKVLVEKIDHDASRDRYADLEADGATLDDMIATKHFEPALSPGGTLVSTHESVRSLMSALNQTLQYSQMFCDPTRLRPSIALEDCQRHAVAYARPVIQVLERQLIHEFPER